MNFCSFYVHDITFFSTDTHWDNVILLDSFFYFYIKYLYCNLPHVSHTITVYILSFVCKIIRTKRAGKPTNMKPMF